MQLNELHLKEYEKLQKEISDSLIEIASVEKFAIATSGGVFAWLLTNHVPNKLAFFIPFVTSFLFGVLVLGLFNRIKLIGAYIRTRYEGFMPIPGLPDITFGWETYLAKNLPPNGSLLANGRTVIWFLHIVANFVIAIYLCCIAPK